MTNPSSTQDLKLNIAELKRLWFVEDAQKHIAKSVEIQMRLGDVYSDLAQIDSPKINLTYAIEAYSKALSYGYWQETDATYALIQVRLGIDYYELASHENGTANLYHAKIGRAHV